MPYCENCGTEISGEEEFCSNCGNSLKKSNSNNISSIKDKINSSEELSFIKDKINSSEELSSIKDKINSSEELESIKKNINVNNASLTNKSNFTCISILGILFLILIVGMLVFGGSGGDLVDITQVSKGGLRADGQETITFQMMPKTSITRVTGVSLTNIQVSFSDGSNVNVDEYVLKTPRGNFFIESKLYTFRFKVKANTYASHVKGDLVIHKADGSDVCIGHLDHDV